LLVAFALTVGGTSGNVLAQNDDSDLAALRAQLEQIRTLVVSFDERLKALELARQAVVRAAPIAPPASTAERLPVAAGAGQLPAAEPFRATQPPATRDHGQTGQAAPSNTAAPDRQAWRQLGPGATQDDVTRLLGAPTKTFQLAGKTVWYYYYPAKGAGSVFFDSAARASSVQSPSSGW
jgi:hypothetical protein